MPANTEAEPTNVENAAERVAEPSLRRRNEGVEPLKHPSVARLGSETSSISLLESVDLFAEGDGFSKIGASDFFQDGVSGFSEHCETVRLRYGALSLCFSEANRVAQEALAHVVFGP